MTDFESMCLVQQIRWPIRGFGIPEPTSRITYHSSLMLIVVPDFGLRITRYSSRAIDV